MPAPEEFKPKEQRAQVQSRYPKPRIDFGSSDKNMATGGAGAVTGADTAAVQRIVPVQVTRHVIKSVSVSGGSDDEKRKKYWKEQAEIAKLVQPFFEKLSPTPKLGDSVSPRVQGKSLSVKLFE